MLLLFFFVPFLHIIDQNGSKRGVEAEHENKQSQQQ